MGRERRNVVISRDWDNPAIEVTISEDGVRMEMSLQECVKAIAREIGNPTLIITNKQLESKLIEAADICVDKIKRESTKG